MTPFVVTPDPSSVVAGWIPLVLIAVLALAMVVLYRSLRKQMRKISIPEEGVSTRGDHHRHRQRRHEGENNEGPRRTGDRQD